jgi:hypothetical protein
LGHFGFQPDFFVGHVVESPSLGHLLAFGDEFSDGTTCLKLDVFGDDQGNTVEKMRFA